MSDPLLAHLGHDLRNPGTTLVSCIELLRDVVRDPDGLEAVEDAELALAQLQRAWARVDVLGGHFADWYRDEVDLVPIFEDVSHVHRATCSLPDELSGPHGVRFILEGLLEATRRPVLEVVALAEDAWELRISDERGVIADPALRAAAFEIERQTDMKSVGRYSRFLGLVAARLVAEHIGTELVSTEDCVFRLRVSRAA